MLKYDFIATDEPFKFRVVERETRKEFKIAKHLADCWNKGDFIPKKK